MRRRALGVSRWVAVLLVVPAALRLLGQAKGKGTPAQGALDFLARPLPAQGSFALPPEYPAQYSAWTEAQRRSGLQLVGGRCSLMNALVHDNPNSRLLPQPMTLQEETQLALSVCLAAKMPPDWPDRNRYLNSARKLIAEAATHGITLQLPANLR